MNSIVKYAVLFIGIFQFSFGYSQESPPTSTSDLNWISNISYSIDGETISKGINYFNTLGKPVQSQTWDINFNTVWGSQTLYDYHGRAALQTLNAPLVQGSYFEFDNQLILDNSQGVYNASDFEGSFEDNPTVVSTNSKLGNYYFNSSADFYQDNTSYPFARTVYSKLNIGSVKKVLGGNKVNGEWKQSYSFSMKAGLELLTSQAFGNDNSIYEDMKVMKTIIRDVHGVESVVFNDTDGNVLATARSGSITSTKTNKVLIEEQGWVDFHISDGCSQSVTLLDVDLNPGNPGGSGGSGGPDCFEASNGYLKTIPQTEECMSLKIQEYESKPSNVGKTSLQKKDDIFSQFERIEVSYEPLPNGIYYRIYDLITEQVVLEVNPGNYVLSEGLYRAEIRFGATYDFPEPWGGSYHISYNPNDLPNVFEMEDKEYGVEHCVGYYDYALNYYDKSGRLIRSTQPKSQDLVSNFTYNSLGELQTTNSPDEGQAQFIYRKDGQIRFSQNTKQEGNQEFSYTNYDGYGRPVESGVYNSDDILFYLSDFHEEMVTVEPVVPIRITTANLTNVAISNNSSGRSYSKTNNGVSWNAGFESEDVLEANGYVSFKYGYAVRPGDLVPVSGDVDIFVGLSPADQITDTNYQNIKYAINLKQSVGNSPIIQIWENGNFIRDTNGNIISFDSFDVSDQFKIFRENGVIKYYKITGSNETLIYTSSDNYTEPLIVDTSFKNTSNAINNVFILIEPVAQESVDIQDLVDVNDGLIDVNCMEQTFTVYDLPDLGFDTVLTTCGLPLQSYKQTFLAGNVSKTYTKKPETNTTWYSYDVYGRVKWIVQKPEGLGCVKTIDYIYDPISGLVSKIDYQRYNKSERFIHKYIYNDGDQLTSISTSLNDVDYTLQAEYIYNDKGQLKRTEIAENLQGIDYIYNLNGQLKAINHPSLSTQDDPGHDGIGTNGFISDVFGMAIQYHDQDYNRANTPTPLANMNQVESPNQYNGNIQGIKWQNQNSGASSTYAYSYNKNNWLESAHFNGNTSSGGDYNVSNITYDSNGNILTLKRNGYTDGLGTNQMDDFNYYYYKNQLTSVDDSADNPDTERYDDLRDQEDSNYIYNAIGQLFINQEDKTMYEYNAAGLVSKIYSLDNVRTSQYHVLMNENYDEFSGVFSMLSPLYFNILAITTDYQGQLRHVRANQEDQSDVFGEGGELLPPGVDNTDVKIPEYCIGFDDSSDEFHSRAQVNFYSNPQDTPNPFKINVRVNTVKGANHILNFDLFLLQQVLEYTQDIDAEIGAVVTLKQESEDVIDTFVINPQNYTQSYCKRILEHLNFEFLSTGKYVTIEIDIDDETSRYDTFQEVAHPELIYKSLYRSAELDNFSLEIANAPKIAFYYNDRGHRIRKDFYTSGGDIYSTYYVRDASGSPLGIYTVGGRGNPLSLKENPVYGASRVGVFYREPGTKFGGNYVYQLTDHLGNVRAVIMKDGINALSLTNKADYYPGGMAMPNRNIIGDYRYNYQGQELDQETGKVAFQLRLYDPRINRWLSPDPYGQHFSPYLSMGNDWVNSTDPDGGWKTKWERFWGWVGNGFKGEFVNSENPGTPWHKYGIVERSSSSDGVLFNYNIGSGWKNEALAAGYIFPNGSAHFIGAITPASGLSNFQFWRDRPADGFGGIAARVGVDLTYGTAENVYTLFLGRTFTGSVPQGNNAFEKSFDGFITLTTLGYSKVASSLKSVKSTVPAWNAYQKSTKGLYSGTGLHANSIKSIFYKEGIKIHNNMVKDVKKAEGVFDDFMYNINNINSSIDAVEND